VHPEDGHFAAGVDKAAKHFFHTIAIASRDQEHYAKSN
jgi:hypothetical protein